MYKCFKIVVSCFLFPLSTTLYSLHKPGELTSKMLRAVRSIHARAVCFSASQRATFSIDNQIIQHPWILHLFDNAMIRYMKEKDIIIKEYAGNAQKTVKLYVMPAELEEKIADGIKSINGTLHSNEYTRKRTHGISEFSMTEQRLAHVLSIELLQANETVFFRGFHYDPHDTLKKIGIIEFNNVREDPITNIIVSEVRLQKKNDCIDTARFTSKTFFSHHWAVEDIVRNAQEACTNAFKVCKSAYTYEITGNTHSGITIQCNIDKKGKVVSFYPVIPA